MLLLIILFFSSTAFALNVVYPHKKQFQFNSDRTFFIGSSNPNKELFINGEKVEVHSSGGFAKVVKLTEGLNVFKLISGDDILIYNISRVINKYLASGNKDCVVFNSPKSLIVNFDKAPLRSTPEDFGINRISHLPVGMILRSNGIKNNFYRVILTQHITLC